MNFAPGHLTRPLTFVVRNWKMNLELINLPTMADPRSWFNFGTPTKSNPPKPPKLVLTGQPPTPGSPATTPSWDIEKDTDALFREHTVEEIKQIEKQTRLDIDSRREDLRQMVGEKYRDLIDAADSIVDMQKCSVQVKQSVESMEQLCQKLQQTHFLKGTGGMRGPMVKNETHQLAAQLKLLADCPEQIWVCLESWNYLRAAQHYLLARHVYSQLGRGGGGVAGGGAGGSKQVSSGTVQKLWQSVAPFKETILECCKCHLEYSDLEEEPMVESLCAMVLLEGCSPRQVFTQFLLARKAAVQAAFSPAGQHRGVKNQICHLVNTLLLSLLHIAAIFCQRQSSAGKREPSLLLQHLQQFSINENVNRNEETGFVSNLVSPSALLQLPNSVTDYSPTLRSTVLTEIPASDVHSSTEDWIVMCVADVQSGVDKLLNHVMSVKALSSIKTAIHSKLAASPVSEKSDHTPWAELWASTCQLVLKRELGLWDTFFQAPLLKRVKFLVDKKFSSAGTHASTQLTNLLNAMTSDPSSYHSDIHCHTYLWAERQSGGWEGVKELSLKSKACTPAIYSFCQKLGFELDGLIEDISHYMQPAQQTTPPLTPTLSSYKSKQLDAFPFPLFADTATLQNYLQQSSLEWVTRFLQQVDLRVTKLQHSGDEEDTSRELDPLAVGMLLVVGRLCQCLMECCSSLSYLITGARLQQPSSAHRVQRVQQQLHKEANNIAVSAAELLQTRASSIFRIWADWTAGQVARHLRGHLSSSLQLSSLASSLVWAEVTISEEAESGKKISSVIRVPSQASTYVTSLLFALCQEVGHVGGHAMDRAILEHLSAATLVGVVRAFEELLGELDSKEMDVPQPCALQLFYNVKFVASVLTLPKEGEEELSGRIKAVLERLQGWVDPFDLDVFMPYILANLENQLSRSSVMLGLLLAIRGNMPRSQLSTSASSSAGGQDKHMVIPLAPVVGRIPTLPLSSKPAPAQNHKVLPVPESSLASSLQQTVTFFHHL